MLELMIVGAAIAAGAILVHKLYKWAQNALNEFRKKHSGWFSKANIEAAWTVFSQLAEVAFVTVITQMDGELYEVDRQQVQPNEIPSDARKHLDKLIKQNRPKRSFFGLFPSKDPESFSNYAVAMEV